MKKAISIILSLIMLFCLCSCGQATDTNSDKIKDTESVQTGNDNTLSEDEKTSSDTSSKQESEESVPEKVDPPVNTEPVQSTLNNIAEDETVDPENVESKNDDGAVVEIENIHSVSGKALGIDVSKWQGKIDWQKVKNAGIKFAIIRIGYRGENGVIYRDENADYNIQKAQKAGVLVGVYFFSTAINAAEAKEEAVWTANAIKGYKISYPVVYDCEGFENTDSRMHALTVAERTKNATEFLSHIKAVGYDTMVYGSKTDFEANQWDMAVLEKDYKIWVAHYSTPTYPQKTNPDYNRRYDMWQYTNQGNVSGVDGGCDMIVSYFEAAERDALDSSATPNTAPPPKTQEEMIYTETNEQVTAKDEVNLRAGAGTNHSVVATIKSGDFVTRVGVGKNGWSKLVYNGQTVYAITSYLSTEVIEKPKEDIVNGMTFTPQEDQVTAKEEVNLRTQPTTDSETAGKLQNGTFLKRTAISNKGWSRLEYNGQVVYVVTNYLTTEVTKPTTSSEAANENTVTEHNMEFTLVSEKVTAKEEVNLRDKPTTDGSNIVHTLKNGEFVTKNGICSSSGWARLEYNGQTVYCVDSFLTN